MCMRGAHFAENTDNLSHPAGTTHQQTHSTHLLQTLLQRPNVVHRKVSSADK